MFANLQHGLLLIVVKISFLFNILQVKEITLHVEPVPRNVLCLLQRFIYISS